MSAIPTELRHLPTFLHEALPVEWRVLTCGKPGAWCRILVVRRPELAVRT